MPTTPASTSLPAARPPIPAATMPRPSGGAHRPVAASRGWWARPRALSRSGQVAVSGWHLLLLPPAIMLLPLGGLMLLGTALTDRPQPALQAIAVLVLGLGVGSTAGLLGGVYRALQRRVWVPRGTLGPLLATALGWALCRFVETGRL